MVVHQNVENSGFKEKEGQEIRVAQIHAAFSTNLSVLTDQLGTIIIFLKIQNSLYLH